jgi:hypothetical protein
VYVDGKRWHRLSGSGKALLSSAGQPWDYPAGVRRAELVRYGKTRAVALTSYATSNCAQHQPESTTPPPDNCLCRQRSIAMDLDECE